MPTKTIIKPSRLEIVSAMIEEQGLTKEQLVGYLRQVMEIRALENNIAEFAQQGSAQRRFAPVRRRRSGGRGSRCGAPRQRPDHQHPSRPRPRACPRRQPCQDTRSQAGALRQDDGRSVGQVRRLLQRQGRLDAHRRRGTRQPGRHRHRRRQYPGGGRAPGWRRS